MKLPPGIANRLLTIMDGVATIPSSAMPGGIVQKMLEDGVLQKIQSGRTKASLFVKDVTALKAYLLNHFGIHDLHEYIDKLQSEDLLRSEAVVVSGNSKLKAVRTFKGFLLNSFAPVETTLHGKHLVIQPAEGSFTFIYDFEVFIPAPAVTIVGIENPENFRYVQRQQDLFNNMQPLFVSRYPQSNDLVKWLQLIPNKYLHFGDLDFAGVNIYLNEYRKHLGEKASIFIPSNAEELLDKYGNRELYNKQLGIKRSSNFPDERIETLIRSFHRYKKVLEQEVFIHSNQRLTNGFDNI